MDSCDTAGDRLLSAFPYSFSHPMNLHLFLPLHFGRAVVSKTEGIKQVCHSLLLEILSQR
jgi:hypothetical protein